MIAGGWLWCAVAGAVEPGAWFEYTLRRDVTGTAGEYRGYTERLDSAGRYDLPGPGQAEASYRWSWSASDGKSEAGSEQRSVSFDPATRRYTGPTTDLDDFDQKSPTDLAVWFWIPPDAAVGTHLAILDKDYVVTRRDARFQDSGVDRPAIEVVGSGNDQRHDVYGNFALTWTETFLFDATHGVVLASRYEEHDTALDGSGSAFDWTESLVVHGASFDPAMRPIARPEPAPAFGGSGGGWACLPPAFLGLVGLLTVVGIGWSLRPIPTEPLADPEALTGRGAEFTRHFAGFLTDIARKAQLLGAPGLVTRSGERITGFACRDPESGVGTVFAADVRTARSLARALGAHEYFVEDLAFSEGKPAETFAVLARGAEPRPTWDPAVVRRGGEADVAALSALNQAIFGSPCARWAQAQLDAGDVLYVAEVDGAVVGFGFAGLAGTEGRLHGLAVHPDHRNRGLGTELARARVRALIDLGAERILTEIAEGNVGSLHIANGLGFARVGAMYAIPQRVGPPRSRR